MNCRLYSVALILVLLPRCVSRAAHPETPELSISTFTVDVTPPIGSPLAYDPTKEITEPLSLRGLILNPEGQKPIVLCSIDWLGVANAAQDEFREKIASATNTSAGRVRIHAIHQHDAPRCDLSAAQVLEEYGLAKQHYDVDFIRDCISRAATAAGSSLTNSKKVTSIAYGEAKVQKVASNRRLLDPDGKVHTTRYTACKTASIRALPEGVIDPLLRSLTFYSNATPVAVLTTYATHPQSYYRTGQANPDFPGMARNQRERQTGVFHLHFNGAGGNIGAGKYNDGSHENRQVLADKVALAMKQAWDEAEEDDATKVTWQTKEIALPLGDHLVEKSLRTILSDSTQLPAAQLNAAKKIALLQRQAAGLTIDLSNLSIGEVNILFMPGELFVEYQLAAQAMLPSKAVMMAAYGEYGTGYIGTRIAYPQGGYEVSERASNVSAEAERILIEGVRTLLGVPKSLVTASDFTDTSGVLPVAQ